jgi:integrase
MPRKTVKAPAPAPRAKTVQEVLDFYETYHVNKTAAPGQSLLRIGYLRRHFADMTGPEIGPKALMDYEVKRRLGKIGRGYKSSGTLRNDFVTLKAAFNFAMEHRLVGRDEIPIIRLPEQSRPRERYLEDDELDKLVQAAAAQRKIPRMTRLERLIWIMMETGSRRGAVEELTWDRVDLANGVIDFRDPAKRATKKRRVPVPISDRLKPVLQRAYDERWPGCKYVLDRPTPQLGAAFRALARDLGWFDVIPHTLRHTWATHAARNGVSLENIALVLGNSIEVVVMTYRHLQPEWLRSAVNFRSNGPKVVK